MLSCSIWAVILEDTIMLALTHEHHFLPTIHITDPTKIRLHWLVILCPFYASNQNLRGPIPCKITNVISENIPSGAIISGFYSIRRFHTLHSVGSILNVF
jgi:hypothetical protein